MGGRGGSMAIGVVRMNFHWAPRLKNPGMSCYSPDGPCMVAMEGAYGSCGWCIQREKSDLLLVDWQWGYEGVVAAMNAAESWMIETGEDAIRQIDCLISDGLYEKQVQDNPVQRDPVQLYFTI